MKETWKSIPGYEGLYEVSDMGNVKTLVKKHMHAVGKFWGKERLKIPQWFEDGYQRVTLSKNSERKTFFIHRLVMLTFVGLAKDGQIVDHINGITNDNRLENLRYCTNRQNSHYSIKRLKTKTSKYIGVSNTNRKLKKKWIAKIQIQGKEVRLGYFATEEEAHRAYQKKLIEITLEDVKPFELITV